MAKETMVRDLKKTKFKGLLKSLNFFRFFGNILFSWIQISFPIADLDPHLGLPNQYGSLCIRIQIGIHNTVGMTDENSCLTFWWHGISIWVYKVHLYLKAIVLINVSDPDPVGGLIL
jgi:hypothetical protein